MPRVHEQREEHMSLHRGRRNLDRPACRHTGFDGHELTTIQVLPREERWYGVKYLEDLPGVRRAIEGLKVVGNYRCSLVVRF